MFILILFFWADSLALTLVLGNISVVICFARPPQNAQPRLPRQYPGVEDAIFSYICHPLRLGKGIVWQFHAIPVPIHFLYTSILMFIGQSQFQTSETFVFCWAKTPPWLWRWQGPEATGISSGFSVLDPTRKDSGGIAQRYDFRSNTENVVII